MYTYNPINSKDVFDKTNENQAETWIDTVMTLVNDKNNY